jgi:hypothetical protein
MKRNTLPVPVTSIEDEALTYAREWLARMREGDFIGGLPPWHEDTGHAMARRFLMAYALAHPFNLDHVVQYAMDGQRDAAHVVYELIAHYRHNRIAMPVTLEAYEMRRSNPRVQRPPSPPARKKAKQMVQDAIICTLIMELIERFPGLRPTRSQISTKKHRPHSYCSIASVALTESGMHRGSEMAVQKVWQRIGPSVLPGTVAEVFLGLMRNGEM